MAACSRADVAPTKLLSPEVLQLHARMDAARRIADTLPPPGAGFVLPVPRAQQGECRLKVEHLADDVLAQTYRAFIHRNHDFHLLSFSIDPLTGSVRYAAHDVLPQLGPALAMSDDEYARRRLAPLWANADLIGLTPDELLALKWEPGGFWGSPKNGEASTARARGPRLSPGFAEMGAHVSQINVEVHFRRDGIVTDFGVYSSGPPLPICITTKLEEAAARRAPALRDELTRLGVSPALARDAKASIALVQSHEGQPGERSIDPSANDRSWTMAWAFTIDYRYQIFIDANSGAFVRTAYLFRT